MGKLIIITLDLTISWDFVALGSYARYESNQYTYLLAIFEMPIRHYTKVKLTLTVQTLTYRPRIFRTTPASQQE
jgi:hypothetical protein